MDFKNFSLAISQTKVARFAEDLAAGKIMSTMQWKELKGEGTLVTFTKIFVPPEHFAMRQPLMPFSSVALEPCPIGLLEVEGGLRVMGWIPKVDLKKIKIGIKMRASPQILPDGKITIVLEPV
jgi:uncharacterized OB-fold protein